MAGYQFAHMATHSRKGNAPYTSVSDITDEAARLPGACPHVAEPKPPTILFGVAPEKIPALLELRIAQAKARSHGKAMRAIRRDTHVLESIVCSHPAYVDAPPEGSETHARWLSERDTMLDYELWRRLTVGFILWDAERRGMTVLSIVEHLDEKHPHIHAYLAPNNARHDAKASHPGHKAKRAAAALSGSKKDQDRAYQAAMRDWQDEYNKRVGEPCGLTRFGPRLERLSREEWHRKQKEAELGKVARERAEVAREEEAVARATAKAAEESTDRAVRKRRENEKLAAAAEENRAVADAAAQASNAAARSAAEQMAEIARRRAEEEDALARVQVAIAEAECRRKAADQAAADATTLAAASRRAAIEQEENATQLMAEARRAEAAANQLRADTEIDRKLVAGERADQRLHEDQHALLLRACDDEELQIAADEGSERGFVMNTAAMNATEKSAYNARWPEVLRKLASRIIDMAERLSNLVLGEQAHKTAKGDLVLAQTEHLRAVAIHKIAVTKLGEREAELDTQQKQLSGVLAQAEAFESAWDAIPPELRTPAVATAIERAAGLRTLAVGLTGTGTRHVTSKRLGTGHSSAEADGDQELGGRNPIERD
jgi:hypothetical protein